MLFGKLPSTKHQEQKLVGTKNCGKPLTFRFVTKTCRNKIDR